MMTLDPTAWFSEIVSVYDGVKKVRVSVTRITDMSTKVVSLRVGKPPSIA